MWRPCYEESIVQRIGHFLLSVMKREVVNHEWHPETGWTIIMTMFPHEKPAHPFRVRAARGAFGVRDRGHAAPDVIPDLEKHRPIRPFFFC